MKVMLCSFSTKQLAEVALKLRSNSIDIVYWLYRKKVFDKICIDKTFFSNTIFHDGIDALQGKPAIGVDDSEFEPLGAEFINSMLACESQTLVMMNSADYTNLPLSKKKHLYYEYLRYWRGVLTYYKPDAILFHDIPHLAHSFVIYHLAKQLNIKTVMYTDVKRIPDRLLFFDDFYSYKKLSNAYKDTQRRDVDFGDLSEDIRNYYIGQTNPEIDSSPIYRKSWYEKNVMRHFQILPNFSRVFKNIAKFTILKVSRAYLRMLFQKQRLTSLEDVYYSNFVYKKKGRAWHKIRQSFKKEYISLQSPIDLSRNFIYLPLHNQPERSTSSEGGVFVDQILMVRMLSVALPDDWVLYVKESPLQWVWPRAHLGRYKGYYQQIVEIPKTYLAPIETSTYDLIAHSKAVATVTGTAGWEAVLRSKPALIFGHPWYAYCHGVLRVSNFGECRDAMDKIRQGFKPDKQQVINFLAALDKVCDRGNDRRLRNKFTNISEQENIDNITHAYLKELGIS